MTLPFVQQTPNFSFSPKIINIGEFLKIGENGNRDKKN